MRAILTGIALLCSGLAMAEVPVVLAIHGGAGTISRETMTADREADYREALAAALEAGRARIAAGDSAVDAVQSAIEVLEESPLFNAGRGAVFNHEGFVELDAAVMRGRDKAAGAVAGIQHVASPIALARAVMERSRHVMLIGEGAEVFAFSHGFERVDNRYFYTERRRRQLERAKAKAAEAQRPDHDDDLGTVGAVALDHAGHLAAGTSTGGMTNKRYGRVGDVPIIGAGTYADQRVAVSATGHGEFFIRYTVAHDIAARMRYTGASVTEAAEAVVLEELVAAGGAGGVIALDADGHVAMPFNTPGMYRGFVRADGTREIAIYH